MINQASTVRESPRPDMSVLSAAESALIQFYPRSRVPIVLRYIALGDWTSVESVVDDVLDCLKAAASSGYPLMRLQSTKGPLVKSERALLRSAVVQRLRLYVDVTDLSDSPFELYEQGLVDPNALFVKGEPHTQKKILAHTERLIASVSTVDECIARLLFSNQNKAEIALWDTTPSKPGIGFDDRSINLFSEQLRKCYDEKRVLASSDVSAWDMNMKDWMFESDVRRRAALLDTNSDDMRALFTHMARVHHHCLTHSLFVLSDGSVYAQIGGGWMKSGSYVTSSTNSWGRCLLATLCGSDPSRVHAMGDDCIEEACADLAEYQRLGYKLKMFEPSTDGHALEFCCHRFGVNGVKDVERLNMEKSMFGLLHKPCTDEDVLQFEYEFRHHPRVKIALEAMSRAGWVPAKDANESRANSSGGETTPPPPSAH